MSGRARQLTEKKILPFSCAVPFVAERGGVVVGRAEMPDHASAWSDDEEGAQKKRAVQQAGRVDAYIDTPRPRPSRGRSGGAPMESYSLGPRASQQDQPPTQSPSQPPSQPPSQQHYSQQQKQSAPQQQQPNVERQREPPPPTSAVTAAATVRSPRSTTEADRQKRIRALQKKVSLSPHFPHMSYPIFPTYHPMTFLNLKTRCARRSSSKMSVRLANLSTLNRRRSFSLSLGAYKNCGSSSVVVRKAARALSPSFFPTLPRCPRASPPVRLVQSLPVLLVSLMMLALVAVGAASRRVRAVWVRQF